MSTTVTDSPIRTGSFDDAADVEAAITELRGAGFKQSEIRIVTSDEAAAQRFAEYIDQQPAGTRTPAALSRAVVIYIGLAVIALIVGLVSNSLITTLIVTSVLLGVALLVTFGSTMMTRGAERELSDFYAAGVIPGQILLAVEIPTGASQDRLAAADRIFQRFTGGHAALDRE